MYIKRGLHNTLYYAWVNNVITSAYEDVPLGLTKETRCRNAIENNWQNIREME